MRIYDCLRIVVLLLFCCFSSMNWAATGYFEVGSTTITNTVNNGHWQTVNLTQSYTQPVVIAGPLTHNNDQSLSVRIKDVTATSFKVGMQNPCESVGSSQSAINCNNISWQSETVQYWVVEQGTWTFPDGTKIEANLHTTSTVRSGKFRNADDDDDEANIVGDVDAGDLLTFDHTYSSNPAVFHTINTYNDSTWVTTSVWGTSVGTVPTTTQFTLALEGGEAFDSHNRETIGWVAIEPGTGTNNGNAYLAGGTFSTYGSADRHDDGCFDISTLWTDQNINILVKHNTTSGYNGPWVRNCGTTSSAYRVHLDEDQVHDTERDGYIEAISWFMFKENTWGILTRDDETVAHVANWKLAAGQVTLPANPNAFTTVTFEQPFSMTPVVVVLPTEDDSDPQALRIKNVTTTSFDIVQVEPPDESANLVETTIDYVAAEPGAHTFPDGKKIEVGTIQTNEIQAHWWIRFWTGWSAWEYGSFTTAFTSTPSFVATIQTMVNEPNHSPGSQSIPWLTTAVSNVTSNGFRVALERSEVNNGRVPQNETIGYIAVEAGVQSSFRDIYGQLIYWESIRTPETIDGHDDACNTYSFVTDFTSAPLAVATKNTRNSTNGGWLRRCALTKDVIGLLVDEDQDIDSERSHPYERGSIFAFSQAFFADFSQVALYKFDTCDMPQGGAISDLSGYGLNGTAQNGATFTRYGYNCSSLALDGTDDYVIVSDNSLLDNTTQVTFMAWFNADTLTATSPSNARGILAKRVDPNSQSAYTMFFWNDHPTKLSIDIQGNNDRFQSTKSDFTTGQWYHAAVVFDGTQSASNRVKLYIDGALDSTHYETSSALLNNASDLYIGNLRTSSVDKVFDGKIDEVRVLSRALNAGEIAAIYNKEVSKKDIDCGCVCIFAGFSISQPDVALACPETRAQVDVTAVCSDGTTKADFTGTVTLGPATSGSVNSDFYLQATGGSALTNNQYTYLDSDNGTKSFYWYYEEATQDLAVTVTYDSSLYTSTDVTDFAASGLAMVGAVDQATCTVSAPVDYTLTAWGKDPTSNTGQCTQLKGFQGVKTMKLWISSHEVNTAGALSTAEDGDMKAKGNSDSTFKPLTKQESTHLSRQINFDSQGQGTFQVTYEDVGRLKLKVKHDAPPYDGSVPGVSALYGELQTAFLSTPSTLNISVVDANAACPSSSPTIDDASCTPFKAAAVPFNIELTAMCGGIGGLTANHFDTGTDNITVNMEAFRAECDGGAGQPAYCSAQQASIDVNWYTGSDPVDHSIKYTEVGAMKMKIPSYTYFGSLYTPNYESAVVGRFYPHHFDLDTASLSLLGECGSNYHYMGQPLSLTAGLIAKNFDDGTTAGYSGGFAANSSNLLTVGHESGQSTALGARMNDFTVVRNDWTNGIASITQDLVFSRLADSVDNGAGVLDGPYTDVLIGFQFNDGDIGFNAIDLDFHASQATCSGDCDSVQMRNGATVYDISPRYGQGRLLNTFGPETRELGMRYQAYYYDGNQFIINAQDNCTTYVNTDASLNFDVSTEDELVAGDTSVILPLTSTTLSSGDSIVSPLTLDKPNNQHTGQVELELTVPDWLKYDWSSSGGVLENPKAIATFGKYRGNDRIIYWKESAQD